MRLGSWVLWSAVLLAALGGVAAWLRPVPAPVVVPATGSDDLAAEVWSVAGFAERYVTAWLTAGPEEAEELAGFLGYTPTLSNTTESASETVGTVRAVDVKQLADRSWAVTVAAGDPASSDGERLWRVGVTGVDGGLAATGLPSPVAAPPAAEQVPLDVTLSAVPGGDDPLVETVEGFVAAHACGDGPLERWLAPDAAISAVTPPVCDDAELDGWGTTEVDDQGRQTVVVEVIFDRPEAARRVTYAVVVAQRDGRWEIAELLPAPPTDDGEAGEVGS